MGKNFPRSASGSKNVGNFRTATAPAVAVTGSTRLDQHRARHQAPRHPPTIRNDSREWDRPWRRYRRWRPATWACFVYTLESLTEIAITHLLVLVALARLDRAVDVAAPAEPLERGLRHLARECGLTPRSGATATDFDFGPMLGHQLLHSEATTVNFRSAHSEPRYAIWVSWDAP